MPQTCSICATANSDDARFCRGCGAALTAAAVAPSDDATVIQVRCPVCRHGNRAGTRYPVARCS